MTNKPHDKDPDFDLSHLEPGCDDNPLEYDPNSYNPFKYTYLIDADVDGITYELAVKFLIQQHNQQDPIEFTNPKTGKTHSIPLFPIAPEVGLDPISTPEPELHKGYQIGEAPYFIVPSVLRVRRDDRIINRQAASRLIDPTTLAQAIDSFRRKVEEDPNGPTGLIDLLQHYDEAQAWKWDDTGALAHADYDEDDEDDEYDSRDNWTTDDETQSMKDFTEKTLGRPIEFKGDDVEDEDDDLSDGGDWDGYWDDEDDD